MGSGCGAFMLWILLVAPAVHVVEAIIGLGLAIASAVFVYRYVVRLAGVVLAPGGTSASGDQPRFR
jgi:hypothetical protein